MLFASAGLSASWNWVSFLPTGPNWPLATTASNRGTTLPENQKLLACRLQEAFAAFLDHTDDQIGRLVEGLAGAMDQLDNTILVVLADNGASQEGGPFGVMHEMMFFNGIRRKP